MWVIISALPEATASSILGTERDDGDRVDLGGRRIIKKQPVANGAGGAEDRDFCISGRIEIVRGWGHGITSSWQHGEHSDDNDQSCRQNRGELSELWLDVHGGSSHFQRESW
jgi:hypothetical protein